MTKREKDIAAMWAMDRITHAEATRKLKVSPNTTYSIIARSLKEIHYPTK